MFVMDDALAVKPVEQIPPQQSKPKPKQQVRFVSGSCQAQQLNSLDCDFSATLEQAFHCIEHSGFTEK
jgi:hypothetical protein